MVLRVVDKGYLLYDENSLEYYIFTNFILGWLLPFQFICADSNKPNTTSGSDVNFY